MCIGGCKLRPSIRKSRLYMVQACFSELSHRLTEASLPATLFKITKVHIGDPKVHATSSSVPIVFDIKSIFLCCHHLPRKKHDNQGVQRRIVAKKWMNVISGWDNCHVVHAGCIWLYFCSLFWYTKVNLATHGNSVYTALICMTRQMQLIHCCIDQHTLLVNISAKIHGSGTCLYFTYHHRLVILQMSHTHAPFMCWLSLLPHTFHMLTMLAVLMIFVISYWDFDEDTRIWWWRKVNDRVYYHFSNKKEPKQHVMTTYLPSLDSEPPIHKAY